MKAYCVLIFIFLFSYPYTFDNYLFKPKKELRTSSMLYKSLPKIERNRLFSLLFGEKRGLNAQDKEAFKDLGLLHLLTPSGLHYSSLIKIPRLVLTSKIFIFLNALLFIFFKLTESFHAITRVSLFYTLKNFSLFSSVKLSFIATFFIDLIFSHFLFNGLSYLLSFLFWGTIIFCKSNKKECLIFLFLNQILIASLSHSYSNPISLILNPVISSLFIFYYPLLILTSLLHLIWEQGFLAELINFFFETILYLNRLFLALRMEMQIEYFFVGIICLYYKRRIIKFLPILLLILSLNTGSKTHYKIVLNNNKSTYQLMKREDVIKIKYKKDSYTLHSKELKCRFKLKNYYWEIRCQKKRPRQSRGPRIISLSYQK